jgi:hypothetical protein
MEIFLYVSVMNKILEKSYFTCYKKYHVCMIFARPKLYLFLNKTIIVWRVQLTYPFVFVQYIVSTCDFTIVYFSHFIFYTCSITINCFHCTVNFVKISLLKHRNKKHQLYMRKWWHRRNKIRRNLKHLILTKIAEY